LDSYRREVITLIEDQHKRYQELATTSATSYQQQQDSVSLRTDLKNETAFLLALKKDSPADFAEQIGISRDYTLGMDYAMQQIGDDPAVWAKVFEANPDLDPLMYHGMGNYGTPDIDVAELRKLYQDTEDLMYDGGLPTEAAALREEAERAKAFEKEYSQVKDKASFNLLCGAVQWAGFSYLKVFVTYIGKLAGGLAKEYLLQGALPAFITATAVSVLVLGKGVLSTILGLMAKGVGFVVDMAGSLWDKITGKSSTKLASRRDKLGQKKYASVALDLDIDTSNPDELVNLTSKGIMEVVKDKLKEVKKYLSGRTVESMRSLAEDIGLSTFNKVAQGEEVNPKTPLEKLIYEKVHGAGSAQEKLEFLSDITQAGSREEIQMLLGISDEEVDVYFSEAGSRGQKLKKYTIVFGSAFLLSLFVYAIAASGLFATATASLMATMKPIALYMHSVLGYQSAVAFYSTLALSAVKSGLISTTIFGIITYGPSWIRKSLGAIASWVGNKISSVWSVIKKGLSYLNPMRYLKKASGVRTRGEALLAIVSLPKEVYRGALIRGM